MRDVKNIEEMPELIQSARREAEFPSAMGMFIWKNLSMEPGILNSKLWLTNLEMLSIWENAVFHSTPAPKTN